MTVAGSNDEKALTWLLRPSQALATSQSHFTAFAENYRTGLRERHIGSRSQIIEILDGYGLSLLNSPCRQIPGISYLIFWLKRKNLEHLLQINFGNRLSALDAPIFENGTQLLATPRGLVSHWIAGNMPTLSVFSWALATLTGNRSLIRVSEDNLESAQALFTALERYLLAIQGNNPTALQMLQDTAVVHFPHTQIEWQCAMSSAADVRVMWGGTKAIESVRAHPRLEHCEDIIFGPKFSVAIADHETLQDIRLSEKLARSLASDIVAFEQKACSSPQILFIESSSLDSADMIRLFDNLESEINKAYLKNPTFFDDESAVSRIISLRAEYALRESCELRVGSDFHYSILAEMNPRPIEAMQYRTLFVQTFQNISQVLPLISPKIQTIGLALHNPQKRASWQIEFGRHGVARCVPVGSMNFFDQPWDGMMPLDRLIYWTRLSD